MRAGDTTFNRAIFRANLDGSGLEMLVDTTQFGTSRPFDVDVIPELNSIIWTDHGLGGVYMANLDGSNPRLLFNMSSPYHIAVLVPEPTTQELVGFASLAMLAVAFKSTPRRRARRN